MDWLPEGMQVYILYIYIDWLPGGMPPVAAAWGGTPANIRVCMSICMYVYVCICMLSVMTMRG